MKTPHASYRLQFHSQFTFDQAQKIVDYLTRLGISDIYASPIFKCHEGSMHGYDIVDPTQISDELGGKPAFDSLISKVKACGLGWIQDIVPNHMAFDSKNLLLMNVLENGPLSKYYQFFDIQWDHPSEGLKGKVLAPFLGDIYGTCLDKNEIRLNFDEGGFSICFYEWKFPLRIECYTKVLSGNILTLEQKFQKDNQFYVKFLGIINDLSALSKIVDPDERYTRIALMKASLWDIYNSNSTIKEYIDSLLITINGVTGDPHSFDHLDELLNMQYFKLSYWKVGNEELNYRRFFTINGLVSLRMENKEVFEYTHALLLQLIKANDITGVRVDHLDGLYNPLTYLNQLRQRHQELYIVVEKILDLHEQLPACMPIQGTTGYDFMNMLNEAFINHHGCKSLDHFYVSFTGQHAQYRHLLSEKKKYFMNRYMAGDIDNLAFLLKSIFNRNRYGKDMTMHALRQAIIEMMAQFPVYRAYMGERPMDELDKLHIKEAAALAQNKNAGLLHELVMIEEILLMDLEGGGHSTEKNDYANFVKKFQQFSGALMAKGAEDTTFYVYNRFVSLNEVGGDPVVFGMAVKDFHELMEKRQKLWPSTFNATATHDTKRSEDVRARLNVLSHIPREWIHQVKLWNKLNRNKKKLIAGLKVRAPVRNDEYFIYQTLVGTYPFKEDELVSYIERIKTYLVKALREAQVYTSWSRPHADYEEACLSFVEEILKSQAENKFLENFFPFQKKVADKGIFNSLAQIVLKSTTPGIPDFYQGTELWDLSLVDPDNRRPVDYERRITLLDQIQRYQGNPGFLEGLLAEKENGAIKLFVMTKLLELRRHSPDLFLKGEYLPLKVEGHDAENIIAFARCRDSEWVITVAATIMKSSEDQWKDAVVLLPPQAPSLWRNILSSRELRGSSLPVSELLMPLSFAVLVSIQ